LLASGLSGRCEVPHRAGESICGRKRLLAKIPVISAATLLYGCLTERNSFPKASAELTPNILRATIQWDHPFSLLGDRTMTTPQPTPSSRITKHQLLMLLLGLEGATVSAKGIGGITRLQKLLFLLWKEAGIQEVETGFEFKPYKAGPYSRKLYDELELLENLGFIQSQVQGEATEAEAVELEELSFDQLMGDDASAFQDVTTRGEATTADTFEERRFTLTKQGLDTVKSLLQKPDVKPFADGIRRIKSKFANYSLQDLLYHVYTKYDDEGWTSESEIRDKVLSKGRRT
jgi:hypothetical protein